MVKKLKRDVSFPSTPLVPPHPLLLQPSLVWNPDDKEIWHIEFENEPINDEKWSCIVTSAIQAEAQDEECIHLFTQCAATGLRKAIKVIEMADVIKLLKEFKDMQLQKNQEQQAKKEQPDKKKDNKKTGNEKAETPDKKELRPPPPRYTEMVELAAKYANYTDLECKLPPDLMAGLLKYMILNFKAENVFWKRVQAVRERKKRQAKIKSTFIRDMKPYQIRNENKSGQKHANPWGLHGPVDDEPVGGPDLYIILVDFYDIFYFSELQRVNVPFIALFKITASRDFGKMSLSSVKVETVNRKAPLVANFWQRLMETCLLLETTSNFKNIIMMHYQAPLIKTAESKQYIYSIIFDELSWMNYNAYNIYRQHQNYLQELYVQRLFLSLEPLDLSKCHVYNKLCDALVTGEPCTIYIIMYAMIEQVVAGVPETESVPLEYQPNFCDFFSTSSETEESQECTMKDSAKPYELVTPCVECRYKVYENPCVKSIPESKEWQEKFDEKSTAITSMLLDEPSAQSDKYSQASTPECIISASFIDQVIQETKTEKEIRQEKKWKTPKLCYYGDSITLQTYHCDPRLLKPDIIVERLLKNSEVVRLWTKYPKPPQADRAFYSFHFFRLWRLSKESRDVLKLKVFFTISMKFIGITKSYLYKGEEGSASVMMAVARDKKLSKVRFDQNEYILHRRVDKRNFSNNFFKTFMVDKYFRSARRTVVKRDNIDRMRGSLGKTDSHVLRKVTSQVNMYLVQHPSSGSWFPYAVKSLESMLSSSFAVFQPQKEFLTLYSLLDCFDISALTEPNFLNDKEEYMNLIEHFNFFESLEPKRMIQRLLDSRENYNTIQCTYFAPTDTLIIIMYNDFDHRGIFFTYGYGSLPTPVSLRDFYNYVYPEINDWLYDEEEENEKFTAELQEKVKAAQAEEAEEYLMNLKKRFCEMNEDERIAFLESEGKDDLEVTEEELGDLPKKPKPYYSNKISFVTTNFIDLRVEAHRNVHEYHSKDGTEVNVVIDSWLYEAAGLLSLSLKQDKLRFCYHQWLADDVINSTFTLRTLSDIIFVFYKEDLEEDTISEREIVGNDLMSTYQVKISWPTGLIIQGMRTYESSLYVKQGYIRVYRKGWEIEDEKSRCYLKNGEVLVFKENGNVDILCASGTKYCLFDMMKGSKNAPEEGSEKSEKKKSEVTTSSCEKTSKTSCNKKKPTNPYKIYIGIDHKTQEIFYKREDGVNCMLWPSGKLVTSYPDGTKITSTPDFDDEEITTEWSAEERSYYWDLEVRHREEVEEREPPRSKTILRKANTSRGSIDRSGSNLFHVDSFVSVSCAYLIEHPKYASVHFGPENPFVEVKMPEDLLMEIYYDGNYIVRQEKTVLKVQDTMVEFYTYCCKCGGKSTATVNLESGEEDLCTFVDFFGKEFVVHRNGETMFEEGAEEVEEQSAEGSQKGDCNDNKCHGYTTCDHLKNVSGNQRCFAFERDLSGFEFLHAEALAHYCHKLPPDTYYELHSERTDSTMVSHTFSNPLHKVGYEKWMMEYEDKTNALPTNLKKKDLKELGAKELPNRLFKYPFPRTASCVCNPLKFETNKQKIEMPKVMETRIVKCLSPQPTTVINELKKHVAVYQKEALKICSEYMNHPESQENAAKDPWHDQIRLKKIARTLDQNLRMYTHVGIEVPSTDKDIHYFGHRTNLMEKFSSHFKEEVNVLPDCKQISRPLPRRQEFNSIEEETEPS